MDAKCKSMNDEAIKVVTIVCRSEFDADHKYDVRRFIFSTADKIGDLAVTYVKPDNLLQALRAESRICHRIHF